jgi:hypothetical protein
MPAAARVYPKILLCRLPAKAHDDPEWCAAQQFHSPRALQITRHGFPLPPDTSHHLAELQDASPRFLPQSAERHHWDVHCFGSHFPVGFLSRLFQSEQGGSPNGEDNLSSLLLPLPPPLPLDVYDGEGEVLLVYTNPPPLRLGSHRAKGTKVGWSPACCKVLSGRG